MIDVEGWNTQAGFRKYVDGRESHEDVAIFGVPPTSTLIQPTLLAGRWLRPDDTQAVVVNIYAMKKEPDLCLGGALFALPLSLLTNYVLGLTCLAMPWRNSFPL